MSKYSILTAALLLSIVGCVSKSGSQQPQVVSPQINHNDKVNLLSEAYFNSMVALSPTSGTFLGKKGVNDKFDSATTSESLNKTFNLITSFEEQLFQIDSSKLKGQALLSYEILNRDLAFSKRGFEFPSYMMPINQMSGLHNVFAGLGSGQSAQPFNTIDDYKKKSICCFYTSFWDFSNLCSSFVCTIYISINISIKSHGCRACKNHAEYYIKKSNPFKCIILCSQEKTNKSKRYCKNCMTKLN